MSKESAVHFESDSFRLKPAEKKALDTFLQQLGPDLYEYRISIAGFTDGTGSPQHNDTLSQRRAAAVADYLLSKGVRRENILQQHFGPNKPAATNSTEDGKALNRRVTVKAERWDDLLLPAMKLSIPKETFTINAQNGGTFTTKSGQKIVIPANSLVDVNGKLVKGNVTLEYIEYGDAVDFLVSGFPMGFTQGGTKMYYQSGGMFSLRAYQSGKQLYVAEGKEVTVNYNVTDTTTKYLVYHFSEADEKWNTMHPAEVPEAKKEPQPEVKIEPEPKKTPDEEKKIVVVEEKKEDIIDTGRKLTPGIQPCRGLELAAETGYNYLFGKPQNESPKNNTTVAIPRNFDERYADLHYAGLDTVRVKDKKGYDIHLNRIKKKFKGKIPFRIYDADPINTELAVLDKATLIYDAKNDHSVDKKTFSQHFCDVRLYYDAEADLFTLEMKSATGFVKFPVLIQSDDDPKLKGDELKKWHQSLFDDYSLLLQSREDAFNKSITIKEVKEEFLISFISYFSDYDFWYFSVPFMSPAERKMTFEQWIAYFKNNPDVMKPRFENLHERIDSICFIPLDTCIGCCACCPRYDSLYPKILLGPQYDNLQLRFFGTFNFDVIYSPKNVVHVTADYTDSLGRPIYPKLLYVIDLSINGIMDMDPYRFKFDKTDRYILLLFDEKGRRYFVEPGKLEKMIFLDNHHYTFRATDITNQCGTMESFRKAIGLEKN